MTIIEFLEKKPDYPYKKYSLVKNIKPRPMKFLDIGEPPPDFESWPNPFVMFLPYPYESAVDKIRELRYRKLRYFDIDDNFDNNYLIHEWGYWITPEELKSREDKQREEDDAILETSANEILEKFVKFLESENKHEMANKVKKRREELRKE